MDIKNKSIAELEQLASDIRSQIIDAVTTHGGHLSSNLGVVELSIAMHYCLDMSRDKIVWDVGHQVYAHKLLSDRSLAGLRTDEGVSGFPSPLESKVDIFTVGHSSTAISSALGLARARDILWDDCHIIAFVGDGALSGGEAYEALNDLGASGKKIIIVLNDNKMSIAQNVGGMSRHLAKLRLNKNYAVFKNNIKRGFAAVPLVGRGIVRLIDKARTGLRLALFKGSVIERLGINYYGPFDGHNLSSTIAIIKDALKDHGAVFLHFVTEKGRGLDVAENNPEKYHGMSPKLNEAVDKVSGLQGRDGGQREQSIETIASSNIVVDTLIKRASHDETIVCVTAAMGGGTGLERFGELYSDRYIDVGIAEQHAVTMSAAMAKGGLRAYFGVYSTFLQRAYDQLLHDVAIDGLPIRLCIDRAGVVSGDGKTHQGIFDIAYLSTVPNMLIMQPKDAVELSKMVELSFDATSPVAIRYSKESFVALPSECNVDGESALSIGQWEWMRRIDDSDTVILAVGGRCIDIAIRASDKVSVVNARFVSPLDCAMLLSIAKSYGTVITIEDGIRLGGFGSKVAQFCADNDIDTRVYTVGYEGLVAYHNHNKALQILADSLQKILQKTSK